MINEPVWFLLLNDMRAGHVEMLTPVAFGPTRESLEDFIETETVDRYVTDGRWHKTFREGGPLEWYNRHSGAFEHFVCVYRYADRAQGLFDVTLRPKQAIAALETP